MAGEITVRYRWTLEEVKESYRWHQRASAGRIRHRMRMILPVIFFILVGCYYYLHYTAPRPHTPPVASPSVTEVLPTVLPSLAVVFLLLVALRFFLVPWLLRRTHAASSSRDGDVSYYVSPEQVRLQGPHSSSEMAWSMFIKAVSAPSGVLLYSQPNLFYWLPKTGFASVDDYDTVLGWIREKVPAVREMN